MRFVVERGGESLAAFAVRFGGGVTGYLNHCPHRGGELDWLPGRFFDASGLYLVCATHGALFAPSDGSCVAGPCGGQGLEPLRLIERDGGVYLEGEYG